MALLGAGGEGKLHPWAPQDMDDVKAVVHSTLDGAAKVAIRLQQEVRLLHTFRGALCLRVLTTGSTHLIVASTGWQ
jgi:hypothetical protein